MKILTGSEKELPRGVFEQLGRYRRRVFMEKLGWQLNTVDDMEQDQFDREDAVYIASFNRFGDVNGCARLLPTTRPYLLGEVFPQLLNGAPVPARPEVWELSRFAAMDLDRPEPGPLGQFSSPVAIDLLETALDCAASRGADDVLAVSHIGVERLLRKAGFSARRIGEPIHVDGAPIMAYSIRCRSQQPASPVWQCRTPAKSQPACLSLAG